MCGIAGYLSKSATDAPIGGVLLDMLKGLARRGPDSAGLACFSGSSDGTSVAWVRLPTGADHETAAGTVLERLTGLAEVRDLERHGDLVRLRLWLDGADGARDLTRALERPGEDFEVVSVGEHLELVKQVGAPDGLEATFGVAGMRGSHGIGHTRLSTESRVDLSHSQPFWARGVAGPRHRPQRPHHELPPPAPDLRAAAASGSSPRTTPRSSASTLPTSWLAGRTLEEALAHSLDDLDGSFTYLVATPRRDRLRARPVRAQAADHRRDRRLRRDRQRGDRDPARPRQRGRRPRAHRARLPALAASRAAPAAAAA